jgi:hypothetical protein
VCLLSVSGEKVRIRGKAREYCRNTLAHSRGGVKRLEGRYERIDRLENLSSLFHQWRGKEASLSLSRR